jgi:hypothetical protein
MPVVAAGSSRISQSLIAAQRTSKLSANTNSNSLDALRGCAAVSWLLFGEPEIYPKKALYDEPHTNYTKRF